MKNMKKIDFNYRYWLNGAMSPDECRELGVDAQSIIECSKNVEDENEALEAYKMITARDITLDEFRERALQDEILKYRERDAVRYFRSKRN